MGNPGDTPGRPPALRLVELLTVGDQTDEDGRLLLEDSATKTARQKVQRAGIRMRSVACPYQDTPSRLGGPMNVSAFEALRTHTGELLDGFAWLTRQRLATQPSVPGTAALLYDVSYLGLSLPLVAFHRATDPFPAHGRLPAVLADLFKASRGLFSVAVDLRNRGTAGPGDGVTAATIVQFADRHGHLVRDQPPRVCAAPTRLIERTIAVILSGEGANPDASQLPEWVDFATLWRSYRVQDELSESLSRYRYVLDQFARAGSAPGGQGNGKGNGKVNGKRNAQGTSRIEPSQFFDRQVPGTRGTFGQLTEAMIAHAHSAQTQLNRMLGRADNPAPISYRELLALL